jgi:hypothetical protein
VVTSVTGEIKENWTVPLYEAVTFSLNTYLKWKYTEYGGEKCLYSTRGSTSRANVPSVPSIKHTQNISNTFLSHTSILCKQMKSGTFFVLQHSTFHTLYIHTKIQILNQTCSQQQDITLIYWKHTSKRPIPKILNIILKNILTGLLITPYSQPILPLKYIFFKHLHNLQATFYKSIKQKIFRDFISYKWIIPQRKPTTSTDPWRTLYWKCCT